MYIQEGVGPPLPDLHLGLLLTKPPDAAVRCGPALASASSLTPLFPSRRFSVQRCARCHLGISASEMVMRARDSVYHLSCFTCSTCNKTLTTGDHFGMKGSLVYCRAHFETLLQGEYPPQLSYTELAAKSGGLALPYFNGTGTVQKGRPRKRKSPALGVDIVNYNSGGCPPHPGRPCRPSPGSARRIPSGFSPNPPWLQEGAFLSKTLSSPQLSVTQKEAGRWSERKREEREGGWGRGEGERERETPLFRLWPEIHSQPWGYGDFPQTGRAKPLLPIS